MSQWKSRRFLKGKHLGKLVQFTRCRLITVNCTVPYVVGDFIYQSSPLGSHSLHSGLLSWWRTLSCAPLCRGAPLPCLNTRARAGASCSLPALPCPLGSHVPGSLCLVDCTVDCCINVCSSSPSGSRQSSARRASYVKTNPRGRRRTYERVRQLRTEPPSVCLGTGWECSRVPTMGQQHEAAFLVLYH